MSESSSPGRRRASAPSRRRPSVLGVLTITLPVLVVAMLALVRPVEIPAPDRSPDEVPLERVTLVCPAALPGSASVTVGNVDGETGEVLLREDGTDVVRELDPAVLTPQPEGPVVVGAARELAPGLVAVRGGGGRARACTTPEPEEWFTGVGAAPEHASTLVLTNPDGGPAVAEVTVLGPDGVVDVPDLRGVTVRGGRTSRFDLSQVVPTREDLTLQVVVTRGRLGVDVEDLVDELGGGTRAEDWLPGQTAPATTSYLAGLGDGPADRTLTLANPGENEARVDVRLVTGESEFEPSGVDEIRVPAGSVTSLDVSRLLRGKVASGAMAVRLDASEPVTASIRSLADDDLYHSVAGATLEDLAAAALPQGGKRLVVVGASAPGVLTWRALDEDGAEIREKRVEVDPGSGVRVKLPDDARMVQVRVERATVVAALEVGPPGWAVIPLTPLEDASLVPDVRPALR